MNNLVIFEISKDKGKLKSPLKVDIFVGNIRKVIEGYSLDILHNNIERRFSNKIMIIFDNMAMIQRRHNLNFLLDEIYMLLAFQIYLYLSDVTFFTA